MTSRRRPACLLCAAVLAAAAAGCGGSGDTPEKAAATATPTPTASSANQSAFGSSSFPELTDASLPTLQDGDLPGAKLSPAVELRNPKDAKAFSREHGSNDPSEQARLVRLGFEKAGGVSFTIGSADNAGYAETARFRSHASALRANRHDVAGDGFKVSEVKSLPDGLIDVASDGGRVARNVFLVRGRTSVFVGYSATEAGDPGKAALIAAAKRVLARVDQAAG